MKKLTKRYLFFISSIRRWAASLSEDDSRPEDVRLFELSERVSLSDSFSSRWDSLRLFVSDSDASLRCRSLVVLRLGAGAESPIDSASDTTLIDKLFQYFPFSLGQIVIATEHIPRLLS